MRAWLYYRLSNDDDKERNSLQNQRKSCMEYAARQGFAVVGESFDDNASGMHFRRDGIQKLTAAVLHGGMDAVVVKDFSRLGRHRTQTALFLDFLREKRVRVLSATENLDSLQEKDDLTIGVRGILNDFYAKDIGRKVRAGYRQKQKEGIVITPPFGYWKDKNTGEIKVDTDAANTVRMIYRLFLDSTGLKEIARRLDMLGCKTPAQLQHERHGRQNPQVKRYRWSYTSVKNVLVNESYTGVLYNHQRETRDGVSRYIPKNERFRHENVFPALVCVGVQRDTT
ncbi:MAG: recombinase family protein [Eubacteriales bacterium]|nr:recombinase family protein [Eubacteriales bacterium]